MTTLRTMMAVGAGKLTASLATSLRLGAGTNLPGRVARKIDPSILRTLGTQITGKTLAITGTNGKTTTCGLLAQFLEEAGLPVVHNQLGANMLPGITAALVNQSSLSGRLIGHHAVLEVDEASLRGVTAEMVVDTVVVTNLFRDQLDRYGELDTTAKLIAQGITNTQGAVVLNADDPLVARLGEGASQALYYGIEQVIYPNAPTLCCPVGFPREVTTCQGCETPLVYHQEIYGHLGHYECPQCHLKRPSPQVVIEQAAIYPHGSDLTLVYGDFRVEVHLPLPGLFNVYNFLAAAAVFLQVLDPSQLDRASGWITQGLAHYQSVFGRAERKIIQGKQVMVMLIKNPVGATEVLKLVSSDPNARLLIALNDNYADGRDVSWIWDAGFEVLPTHQPIVVSGHRAEDMAVRLKYAGIPEEQIIMESSLSQAIEKAVGQTQPHETLYILPTYTALLSLKTML